jgi:hypothetical protein
MASSCLVFEGSARLGICAAGNNFPRMTNKSTFICASCDWPVTWPRICSFRSTILFSSSQSAVRRRAHRDEPFDRLSRAQNNDDDDDEQVPSGVTRWSFLEFEQLFRSLEILDFGLFMPTGDDIASDTTNDDQ